jgi:hypothetical protein
MSFTAVNKALKDISGCQDNTETILEI